MIISCSEPINTPIRNVAITLIALGLVFQIGHFIEHGFQFAIWLTGKYQWVISNFCGRDTPFMSQPVSYFVESLGAHLFPNEDSMRQWILSIEILHLIGNSIFLITIGILFFLLPSKLVKYAFLIELVHLCEHVALTFTAYYYGKPIGLSTLFGHAAPLWGKELAVGWRVSWHFVMNLLPMPFVMVALMRNWSLNRNGLSIFTSRKIATYSG